MPIYVNVPPPAMLPRGKPPLTAADVLPVAFRKYAAQAVAKPVPLLLPALLDGTLPAWEFPRVVAEGTPSFHDHLMEVLPPDHPLLAMIRHHRIKPLPKKPTSGQKLENDPEQDPEQDPESPESPLYLA